MNRTTLLAALGGAALVLAGCTSTSGTVVPAASSFSPSASSSSPSLSPSPSASSSGAPPSVAFSSSTANSTTEPSSSGESSGGMESSSAARTSTVGGSTEGLDAQSTAWFTAFCGGLAPVLAGAESLTQTSGASDSAASLTKLVALYEALGTTMTKTSTTLKGLSAPTFEGGSEFAGKVVSALGTAGPALSAGVEKLAADPSSRNAGSMSTLSESLTTAVAPIEDLESLKLTPATRARIGEIPACAAVRKAATG